MTDARIILGEAVLKAFADAIDAAARRDGYYVCPMCGAPHDAPGTCDRCTELLLEKCR